MHKQRGIFNKCNEIKNAIKVNVKDIGRSERKYDDHRRKNRKQENKEQECTGFSQEAETLAESGGKIAHHSFWGAL